MSTKATRLAGSVGAPRSAPTSPTNFDRQTAAVLRSFNTWAFKREQPCDPELLAQTVANQLARSEPISFVLYWGKGPRATIATPEFVCLDFLASMGARIAKTHEPGARFNLCLTDTHARLNGHKQEAIDWYFDAVAEAASMRGMTSERLSQLTQGIEPYPDGKALADTQMLDSLERCAARWYRGAGDVRDGARTYLEMNHVESTAVAAHYRGSIFITFNGSTYRDLFPASMPVFYMYSLRRGTAVKPWFMNEHGVPYIDADADADANAVAHGATGGAA